jgi:hypothetical protein
MCQQIHHHGSGESGYALARYRAFLKHASDLFILPRRSRSHPLRQRTRVRRQETIRGSHRPAVSWFHLMHCRNGSRLSVPRPPTSSAAARGRTATSRASTPAFAMSCSTARSSTLCARPRPSSKAGDATTTRLGLTPQSDTSHGGVRACIRRVAGCYADRLRRPRWHNGQP